MYSYKDCHKTAMCDQGRCGIGVVPGVLQTGTILGTYEGGFDVIRYYYVVISHY